MGTGPAAADMTNVGDDDVAAWLLCRTSDRSSGAGVITTLGRMVWCSGMVSRVSADDTLLASARFSLPSSSGTADPAEGRDVVLSSTTGTVGEFFLRLKSDLSAFLAGARALNAIGDLALLKSCDLDF